MNTTNIHRAVSGRRRRGLLILAASILLSLTFPSFSNLQIPSAQAQSPADVAKGLERFIVKIFPLGQTSGPFAGSGFVLRGIGERTLLATSLAVAARLDRVTVVDLVGTKFDGTVSLRHVPTQLALISVNGWTGPRIVDVDARPLRVQEPLVVLGFDRQTGGGAFVTTRAAGSRKLADELPPGFEGGPIVGLDQRILGLAASLQGDVVPSASILDALTTAASPPPVPSPPTSPAPAPSPPPVPSPAPPSSPPPIVSTSGLAIRSFPSGADVYWAGQLVARTPTAIERRAGVLALRFSLSGHADVGTEDTVSARTDSVYVVLPPALGSPYGRTPYARNKIGEGLSALAAGDSVNAVRRFREALESDYRLIELKVYIGLASFMQGRLDDALASIRDYVMLGLSGQFPMTAYAVMGLVYERQGRFAEALTGYKLALRQHPAMAQEPANRPAVGEAELRNLVNAARQQPNRPEFSYRLGIAYEANGRFREGMQAFKDALFALGPP